MADKIYCDRCGQECTEGSTYYTIDIYGHDINPTNDGRVAFDAYVQNFSTNLSKITKQEKHYCKKCKDEIEQFIKPKTDPNAQAAPEDPDDSRFDALLNKFFKGRGLR